MLRHDRRLFDELFAEAALLEPAIRRGAMFGCPAAFVESKMAFCVFGDEVGAKVPESVAASLLARGVVTHFKPYGKAPMREWISIAQPFDPDVLRDVVSHAVGYARRLGSAR